MFLCEIPVEEDLHQEHPIFFFKIPPEHFYFLDHKVRSTSVLPGVVCLELALKALNLYNPHFSANRIENVVWTRPVIPDEEGAYLSIRLEQNSPHTITYQLFHKSVACGSGCLQSSPLSPTCLLAPKINRLSLGGEPITHAQLYDAFEDIGITYGPFFRCVQTVRRYPGQYAEALLTPRGGMALKWANLLDCAFQVGMAISIGQHNDSLMPYTMGYLQIHAPLPSEPLPSAFVLTEKLTPFRTSLSIFDHTHTPLLSVCDLGVKPSNFPDAKERHIHAFNG